MVLSIKQGHVNPFSPWFHQKSLQSAEERTKMATNPALLKEFPVWALLPKRETGVTAFLTKYPEYDGRGIKIAILDSGIDPGAPGLQVTSTGQRKIISMMDASGAGDVDMSHVVEAVNGEIVGLTSRRLKIPSSWTNPSGKYHIGVKNAFELYPKQLKDRIQKLRKEKHWDPVHKTCQAEAARKLQAFEHKHTDSSTQNIQENFAKEDLEAQVEILNTLDKKYNDLGPVYDCVVFNDGNSWKAVIDTTEVGNLEKCRVLGSFDVTHEYATLTEEDMLNYCVNIHDDGNLLEIVAQSTSHGTHVASIAAAYFPDLPEKNGIAPGAQLVSIGIGDIRLGSMETGSALVRAMIKVVKTGCNVINMSYGEHAHWSGGRVMEIIHETVNKHGVIMVVSAGNHGPALGTIGTPPAMHSSSVIGVGAYVSPEMMLAEYSMRDVVPGMGYTWTSRGPTADGDLGVCICAPGGAITSVPNWTLRGSILMHGTSMSSPHVAGSLALLLSGMKSRGLQYSPYCIRRAIETTALKVDNWDAFSMGHGLLQVEKAFEHLIQYSCCCERDVRFRIACGTKSTTGILIREPHEIGKHKDISISVEPIFLNNNNVDPQRKISFNMNLRFVCDVPWVSPPTLLNLMYACRSFNVKVDPTGLSTGAHFTYIRAYDSQCPEKGPVFEIPVTVIKTEKIVDEVRWERIFDKTTLKPNVSNRHFFEVPCGATWAVVRIKSLDVEQTSNVVIHAVQYIPQRSCKYYEFYKNFTLNVMAEANFVFPVKERRTLELCVAKWWSHLGDLNVSYSIYFHGLCPGAERFNMLSSESIFRVDLLCSLRTEDLLPSVTLKHQMLVLRPTSSTISPLGHRDIIPEGRQIYELLLTYNFNVPKVTEVMPNCPLLGGLLYESEYESQLWMLFDSNKQLLAAGDAFPDNYSVKVEKGDYTLRFQVRHEQRSLLEKLTEKPMQVCLKLSSSINLDVYANHSQALVGGKKFTQTVAFPGTLIPVFIASIPQDKIPKGCNAGQYLCGHITFAKEAYGKKDRYPFTYTICDVPKKSSSKGSPDAEEEFAAALRDLKISWVAKLPVKASLELFEELAKESKPLPLLHAKLQALDNDKERTHHLNDIIKLADEIVKAIDTTEILASIVAKENKKENNSSNKIIEKQKLTLIDTLSKKGIALCDLLEQFHGVPSQERRESIQSVSSQDKHEVVKPAPSHERRDSIPSQDRRERESSPGDTVVNGRCGSPFESQENLKAEIDKVYQELLKWAELHDTKASVFFERHARLHAHYGRVLKILQKQFEDKPTLELEKKFVRVFKQLGWTHCANFFEKSSIVRHPPSYRLF